MSTPQDQPPPSPDDDLQREIRKDRKFTLAEAIGRLAGPGAMKGASPVSRKKQVQAALNDWLTTHLSASQDALKTILLRQLTQSPSLFDHFDEPLTLLAGHCRQLLNSDHLLQDLVRDTDVEWSRIFGERPHFDRPPDSPPDPDDPFTIASVRLTLSTLIEQLPPSPPPPA